jgi:hypothetical protein
VRWWPVGGDGGEEQRRVGVGLDEAGAGGVVGAV